MKQNGHTQSQNREKPYEIPTVATIIPVKIAEGNLQIYLQNRVLKESEQNFLKTAIEFPQGHLEGQETPLEAGARELLEETGMVVAEFYGYHQKVLSIDRKNMDLELCMPIACVMARGQLNYLSLVFVAQVIEPQNDTGKQESQGQWIPLNNIQSFLKPKTIYPLNAPLISVMNNLADEIIGWIKASR